MNERNEKNENPALIFDTIVPHPEPVIAGELLTEIETTIKKHVVLSDAAATALAVWVTVCASGSTRTRVPAAAVGVAGYSGFICHRRPWPPGRVNPLLTPC